MPIIAGNTTGSISSTAYNVPATITSWFLTNMTAGGITVGLIVIPTGDNPVTVWSGTIAANGTEKSDIPIKLLAGFVVIVTTSGSLDYFLCID